MSLLLNVNDLKYLNDFSSSFPTKQIPKYTPRMFLIMRVTLAGSLPGRFKTS